MDTERLAKIYGQQQTDETANQRHASTLEAQHRVSNTVIDAVATLIKYLQSTTTKTEVVNQLKEIGTPDALKVIPEIQALHETLKTHENVDLTDLTAVMRSVFDEVKAIPKALPEPTKVDVPDYADEFKTLTAAVREVIAALQAQKLTVAAPEVKVEAPNVQVDAPDLSPISAGLDGVKRAVVNSVVDVQKTQDISGFITEQYDQFIAGYEKDDFGSGESRIANVKYLLAGKLVAKLTFDYNSNGDIKSVKKS